MLAVIIDLVVEKYYYCYFLNNSKKFKHVFCNGFVKKKKKKVKGPLTVLIPNPEKKISAQDQF